MIKAVWAEIDWRSWALPLWIAAPEGCSGGWSIGIGPLTVTVFFGWPEEEAQHRSAWNATGMTESERARCAARCRSSGEDPCYLEPALAPDWLAADPVEACAACADHNNSPWSEEREGPRDND